MKEIKAYVRTGCLEQIVTTLVEQGAPGITVITVHPIGGGFEPRFSFREEEIIKRYYEISKIELVCDNDELDKFVEAILAHAHSGTSGDGMIFISDVNEVVKIRTKKRGSKIVDVS